MRDDLRVFDSDASNATIAVIPSLVSLSTDFFTGRVDVDQFDSAGDRLDQNVGAAAATGSYLAPSTAAAAGSTVGSFDFRSTFPALDNSNTVSSVPALRLMPRQNNLQLGSTDYLQEDNTTQQTTRRSVTPPIGPQGAPIPQHILTRLGNQTTPSSSSAAASASDSIYPELQEEPSSPNPRQIFTTTYQNAGIQLSAPARLGRSTPSSQGRQVESKYINVVSSLAEAVARMERRIEEGEIAAASHATRSFTPQYQPPGRHHGGEPSTPRRTHHPPTPVPSTPSKHSLHKDNIDELESCTITKLAEVMLHPPIGKVVECGDEEKIVRHVWNDDDLADGREDELVDSPMEGMDEAQTADDADTTAKSKLRYATAQSAHESIANLGLSIPRRVCQHPFRKNDIVW